MIFRETALSLKSTSQPRKQTQKRCGPAACLSLALGIFSASTAWALPSDAVADRSLGMLLPANTPTAIILSANPQDWQALEQFELFAKIAELTGGFGSGGSPAGIFFAPPGVDYATEIEPWIGAQIAIATLPDTTPRSIALTDIAAETFVVVPIANEAELSPFLEKLEASREESPEKSTYLGAELWVWPARTESYYSDKDGADNWQNLPEVPHESVERTKASFKKSLKPGYQATAGLKAASLDSPPPLPGDFEPEPDYDPDYDTYEVPGYAVAKIDGYLIFSTELETLKTLLDYGQFNTPKLGDSELFLRSQYGETEGAVARLYGNLSEVTKYNLDGSLIPTLPNILGLPGGLPGGLGFPPASSLGISQETRAIASKALAGTTLDILLYPQAEGLRLQGRIYGNDSIRSQATPELPYADSALAFVPAPAYSLNSGRDIAGLWRQVAANLSLNEATRGFLEQARRTVSLATGLDLDSELLGWMDREFVLFFFPSNQGAINSFAPGTGVEIGMAIQTSDRPTAQTALDTLDNLVGSFITTTSTTINDTLAISWEAPSFSANPSQVGQYTSYLSHGWIAEDTVIITSGSGAMAHLLNAPAFEPITRHSTFLNATRPLANPNNGYSYLNAGSTFSLAYALASKWLLIAPDDPFFQQVKSYLGTIRSFGSTASSTDEYWQLDSLMNLAPAEE